MSETSTTAKETSTMKIDETPEFQQAAQERLRTIYSFKDRQHRRMAQAAYSEQDASAVAEAMHQALEGLAKAGNGYALEMIEKADALAAEMFEDMVLQGEPEDYERLGLI